MLSSREVRIACFTRLAAIVIDAIVHVFVDGVHRLSACLSVSICFPLTTTDSIHTSGRPIEVGWGQRGVVLFVAVLKVQHDAWIAKTRTITTTIYGRGE